jgi:hypothetical protein
MLLDFFSAALKPVVFEVLLDKLENFGGYQRALGFESFEHLIG